MVIARGQNIKFVPPSGALNLALANPCHWRGDKDHVSAIKIDRQIVVSGNTAKMGLAPPFDPLKYPVLLRR